MYNLFTFFPYKSLFPAWESMTTVTTSLFSLSEQLVKTVLSNVDTLTGCFKSPITSLVSRTVRNIKICVRHISHNWKDFFHPRVNILAPNRGGVKGAKQNYG